ncbi:MAG: Lrp/AsnC family transcriptional regulator, partial [Deltaproteobacteria bacterium]|nr:Lrp/AsnC family transcriptional regulator [Deltaproteobacteria bacterium]
TMDPVNQKILVELQKNSRQSDASLARRIGRSETSVRRRIGRMIETKIINITAVTTPWRVGLNASAFIGLQVELPRLEEIMAALALRPRVHFIAFTTGRFDIMTWVTFQTAEELGRFLKQDLAAVTGITRFETMMIIDWRKRDQRILIDEAPESNAATLNGEPATSHPPAGTPGRLYEIDDRDRSIIRQLQQNARQSDAMISRKLSLSESTVRRRIKRLIDEGVITVSAVTNPFEVGFTTVAFIGLQAQLPMINHICRRLAAMPRVHSVLLTTGHNDIMTWVTLRSPQELTNFMTNDLSSVPGITGTEILVNLEIKKRELGLL